MIHTSKNKSLILYVQITDFIGYYTTEVMALVDILALYQNSQLCQYLTGEPRTATARLYDKSIIILNSEWCQFETSGLMKYSEIDIEDMVQQNLDQGGAGIKDGDGMNLSMTVA